MKKQEFIKLVSRIMEGTQVPRSLGSQFLGTATEPWDELRDKVHAFGWINAEEIEQKIIDNLEDW